MSKYARSGPPGLYAVLDYRAGLAMSSRYAHRLHEMISFRAGREKQVERDRQVVSRDRKWGCATFCHAAMLFAQSFQRSNAATRL